VNTGSGGGASTMTVAVAGICDAAPMAVKA